MSRIAILPLLLVFSTIVRATTDVQYCEENAEYEVKVKEVNISPNPIAQGEPATELPLPSLPPQLVIEVTYFGWHIHSETHELCSETTCPVETGDFLVAHSQVLPGYTPPGSYSLQMKMLDAQKKELTCIKFSIDIGSVPSVADM
ncbi:hypothetical protein Bca101_034254 [Brassica carinata]